MIVLLRRLPRIQFTGRPIMASMLCQRIKWFVRKVARVCWHGMPALKYFLRNVSFLFFFIILPIIPFRCELCSVLLLFEATVVEALADAVPMCRRELICRANSVTRLSQSRQNGQKSQAHKVLHYATESQSNTQRCPQLKLSEIHTRIAQHPSQKSSKC